MQDLVATAARYGRRMNTIRKLPASAGAHWMLGGVSLLRRAPVALGLLGGLWGVFGALVFSLTLAVPALAAGLQFALALAGPVLFAGLVWAVHEVASGRPAEPGHLLQALRQGLVPQLLATLLPQLAAGMFLALLLLALIGSEQQQQLAAAAQEFNRLAESGVQPSPEEVQALVADLPAGRILLWLLLVVVSGLVVAMTVFVSVPRILFDRRPGLAAMSDSLRASVHNLPALLVFFVVAFMAISAIYFAVLLATLVAQFVLGAWLAAWIAQILLMALVMPLLAGAVLTAWAQLFGQEDARVAPASPGPATGQIEA
jgi:hypothetical protein